jgi:NADH dehydrogenase FAD-containing subunit
MKNKIKLYPEKMYDKKMDRLYNHTIFAVGARSNDLTSSWKTTPKLNLIDYPNIFAGGDCIVSEYPKNAQVAYQQGKYVAEFLNGQTENDFTYDNKGIALYLGNYLYYCEINTKLFGQMKVYVPSFLVNLYYRYK